MRRLRILVAVPLLATLLFAGAAPTSAASPTIPGLPGLGGLPGLNGAPYINYGFECSAPGAAPVSAQVPSGITTDDSFVILWPTGQTMASIFGQPQDFNMLKCIFRFDRMTTVRPASVTSNDFRCSYPGPWGEHVFAHSVLIVRDTFAILICTGTENQVN